MHTRPLSAVLALVACSLALSSCTDQEVPPDDFLAPAPVLIHGGLVWRGNPGTDLNSSGDSATVQRESRRGNTVIAISPTTDPCSDIASPGAVGIVAQGECVPGPLGSQGDLTVHGGAQVDGVATVGGITAHGDIVLDPGANVVLNGGRVIPLPPPPQQFTRTFWPTLINSSAWNEGSIGIGAGAPGSATYPAISGEPRGFFSVASGGARFGIPFNDGDRLTGFSIEIRGDGVHGSNLEIDWLPTMASSVSGAGTPIGQWDVTTHQIGFAKTSAISFIPTTLAAGNMLYAWLNATGPGLAFGPVVATFTH